MVSRTLGGKDRGAHLVWQARQIQEYLGHANVETLVVPAVNRR